MPKGELRDSGLTHYLAGIENREALLRSPQLGHNFESLIVEEMIKGIQAGDRGYTMGLPLLSNKKWRTG